MSKLILDACVALKTLLIESGSDLLYVALAEEEQCKIVTVDKRILDLFPGQAISLNSH